MSSPRRIARCDLVRSLGRARNGSVAVLFAVMLVPLIIGAGAGVDFARLEILKSSLQSVADGAALAGATSLSQSGGTNAESEAAAFFTKGANSLASIAAVSAPVVTMPTTTRVQVSATASLQMTLMGVLTSAMTVNVLAIAQGPAYALKITNNDTSSSTASDSNSVYFYTVASDGSLPASTSQMTLLFTNDKSVDSDPAVYQNGGPANTIALGANDQVGFALVNVTSAIPNKSYGANFYGAPQGSTHVFYSSASVPSLSAYPNNPVYKKNQTYYGGNGGSCYGGTSITTTNSGSQGTGYQPHPATDNTSCNWYPCVTYVSGKSYENNLLVGGSCATKATAVQTCLQLSTTNIELAWNDMGGRDYDPFRYTAEDFTVSCVPSTGVPSSQNNPTNVSLIQ